MLYNNTDISHMPLYWPFVCFFAGRAFALRKTADTLTTKIFVFVDFGLGKWGKD